MRDDAVLRRALPLGRGLGREEHEIVNTCINTSPVKTRHHRLIFRTAIVFDTITE